MNSVAIVVTCHEPYLKWIPEVIRSIEQQWPVAAEHVLVCDGCEPPPLDARRWRTVAGRWGHPSDARNAGLATAGAPWVIFWDADNIMVGGYLAAVQAAINLAGPDTAIIYPDLEQCDEYLRPHTSRRFPAWDYWELRAENYVDTAAAWRREALEMVGGWSRRSALEDYALALDLTALGWQATKLNGPPVLMRVHHAGRVQTLAREGKLLNELWRARSLAIVSLLAGREETFTRWTNFLLRAELPHLALRGG